MTQLVPVSPLSISVIIATYNSDRTLMKCLVALSKQKYPKSLIEIIIVDGGSTDESIAIAKKFGVKIITVPSAKQNAEYNKGVGVKAAKNDIVLLLDHDNILPHNTWLTKMVQPFAKHPNVVGVEPLRFHYDPRMTLLDRYCALIGGSDPVVYYLGKDSHLSWASDTYDLMGEATDMGQYYLVRYSQDGIPALGGNAAALRRSELLKCVSVDPDHFMHTDIIVDLVQRGSNTFALLKDTIIHLTNNKLFSFLLRRKYFIDRYQFEQPFKRKFLVYDPAVNKGRLIVYILLSLTLIVPLYDSLRGFRKIHDIAWFIHPFMCVAFLVMYGTSVIQGKFKSILYLQGHK